MAVHARACSPTALRASTPRSEQTQHVSLVSYTQHAQPAAVMRCHARRRMREPPTVTESIANVVLVHAGVSTQLPGS